MKVRDLMTAPAKSCRPDTNLAAAAMIMWENDCGAVPVVDEQGKVIGMITDRDICIAVATKHRLASQISVGEAMARSVHTGAPEDDVKSALETMQKKKVRRLPVVNAAGQLEGILCMNDILLRAEEARGKAIPDLSCQDAMSTLRAISEHRTLKSTIEPRQPQKVALA